MGGEMITDRDIKNATMHINGVDIYHYDALLESFKVGATKVEFNTYQGKNRTSFNLLSSQFFMRPITLSLFFKAKTRRELALKKAVIDNLLYGKPEIWLPDGFFYSVTMKSAGEEQILGVENNEVIALCTYSFEGIRHDKLETVAGNIVDCKSLIQRTDCRLTCTASQVYASITIDSVTITNVAANDILTVDGINGRILQNGAPCAGNMSFLHFPYLVPGLQEITCPETLTIEYYPTY